MDRKKSTTNIDQYFQNGFCFEENCMQKSQREILLGG
jgi:hypothetical protein